MLATIAPLLVLVLNSVAQAQTVNTYSVSDTAPGGVIADQSCSLAATSQIVRTFSVPTSYVIGDLDIGVLVTHTYRSDLRMFLTSPAGTTVNFMTFTGNTQSGDNWNDLFDDEAAGTIDTHNTTVTDPTAPVFSHSFRPSNPLSAFDGQNALGTWTLRICDAVAADTGNFLRADLTITSTSLALTKTLTVISDPINGTTNPKAIPGAIVEYCVLATNNGRATAPNATVNQTTITVTDPIPANLTFVPGTLFSGTTCATATATTGVSIAGTTVTGTTASLAPGATFAILFRATVN